MNKLRINLNNQDIPNTFSLDNEITDNKDKNTDNTETNQSNITNTSTSKQTRKKSSKSDIKDVSQETKQITDIIFILDRSGSMSGLESDTIGGFNSMIEKQKKENINDETFITTVLFDNTLKTIHNRTPLNDIKTLTEKDYFVGGTTALFDAIGFTLNNHKKEIEKQNTNKKENNTIVIITTDGYENSSREYNYKQIKDLITSSKDKGWEFIFLGANINSEEFGNKIGIGSDNSINYSASEVGTSVMFEDVSRYMLHMRRCGPNSLNKRKSAKSMFKNSIDLNNKINNNK